MSKRDELWETLVETCGASASEMTRSERGRYNHALKQLKEVNATPEQIKDRAGRYRAKYQGIDLTPTALAAHWSSLSPPRPNPLFDRHRAREAIELPMQCSRHGRVNCRECAERARNNFLNLLRNVRIGEVPE